MADRRRGSTASTLAGRSSRLDCLPSPPSTPEALPAAWLDAARSAPPSSAAGSSAPCTSRPCAGSASTWSACSGPRKDRAAARASQVDLGHAYGSLDELLDDDRVQVVHVTSPNELHYPQVKAILAAGRHVVCEKPLAMTAAESGDLVRLAAASGLVNAVNFNIRFYPLNQHVSSLHPRRRRRRRPADHRPLLPGLAALRHRLELAARARPGRRAAGGGRHRVPLARPDDVPLRPPRACP